MKIKLQPAVIAGLYKDLLVLAEEDFQPTKERPVQFTNKKVKIDEEVQPLNKKWFLGDNKKNILILIRDTSAVYINDEWLVTLSKLLSACKLDLGDIAIVNHIQQSKNFTQLREELHPHQVLMFDVTTNDIQLPFTIPHYQVQRYGGCTFMTSPVLTLTIENTDVIKAEKRKLWEKMKMIFEV